MGADGKLGAIDFDSKREAKAYVDLRMREKAGEIRGLKLQPEFELRVNNYLICKYRGDFEFEEMALVVMQGKYVSDGGVMWRRVIADSKGYRTRDYVLKRKLMKAIHGIEIREL